MSFEFSIVGGVVFKERSCFIRGKENVEECGKFEGV